jgi:hypothetical protein
LGGNTYSIYCIYAYISLEDSATREVRDLEDKDAAGGFEGVRVDGARAQVIHITPEVVREEGVVGQRERGASVVGEYWRAAESVRTSETSCQELLPPNTHCAVYLSH